MKPDSARQEIRHLHRQLHRRQKLLIGRRLHGRDAVFRAYERRFERRVRSFERTATFDEVVRDACGADVVLVGDYHTLKQSQRWFVKLARRLVEAGREVVVALEFAEARHQPHVDAWLQGRTDEAALLRATGYDRRHAFDIWPNFRPIFEFAREQGLLLVGIERARRGSLAERDAFFAARVDEAARRHPGAVVLVLTGQLHLAPAHLPQALARRRTGLRTTTILQNADAVWFALEERGVEHETQAVRVREGTWCLINTSPLVAQQSFLDWVEDGELVETTQPERHFRDLARLIAAYLDIDLGEALDAVEVYTAGDLSFLERLREGGAFTARELAAIRRQILSRESYYIPRLRIDYLAGLSMNHAAEEAAHFLRHVVTGNIEPSYSPVDGFYARALEEALAFFGSKLVNPRRKAPHPSTLEHRRRASSEAERRVARLVLAHLALERGRRDGAWGQLLAGADAAALNDVTHALGYMLGEKLWRAHVDGLLSKDEVRRLFVAPLEGDGVAAGRYFELSALLSSIEVPAQP